MANAFVQSNTAQYGANSASARTCQYSSNTTSGNVLIACIATQPASGTAQITLTVSDNVNGSWTQAGSYVVNTNNGLQLSWWYFANCAGGSRPIVSSSPGASCTQTMLVNEFSVTSIAGFAFDHFNSNFSTTAATPYTTGTVTVSQSGSLVLAAWTEASSTLTSCTASGSFVTGPQVLANSNCAASVAYEVNEGSNVGCTFTPSSSTKYSASIVSFKTTSAGGPFPMFTNRSLSGGMIPMSGGVL
jgi:hypothetical protein